MGSITDFLETELLDHVLNGNTYTPAATVYLALSTTDPLDTGAGITEPVGNGYAREAITFSAAATRTVTQNALVTFTTATGAWGTLAYWAIFDALTVGNALAYGSFTVPKAVVNGNTASVANGETVVEFTTGFVSDYLSNELLDHAFRNSAYTAPATYIALTTANVTDAMTGTTITEPSGFGYARELVDVNGGASPAWSAVAAGAASNGANIDYTTPTGSWGTIVAMSICDAATVGNALFYDNAVVDQAVTTDDAVSFPSGDLDISIS